MEGIELCALLCGVDIPMEVWCKLESFESGGGLSG